MRETPVVWSPQDFLKPALQHHQTPGPSQGGRDHITQGDSTPLTSRAQEPPPRQEQLVLQCLSSRRAQADRHFWRLDGEYSISVGKKEPFPEPSWATFGVEEPQAADTLTRCCFLFAWDRCFLCCDQANSCLPGTWLSAGPPVNQSMSTPDQPRAAPAVTRG